MSEPILGQQILKVLAQRGLTYAHFRGQQRDELGEVVTVLDLRRFFDRAGFDCISAEGSAAEVVERLRKNAWDNANSRNYVSAPCTKTLRGWTIHVFAYQMGCSFVHFFFRDWHEAVLGVIFSLAAAPVLILVAT